MRQDTVVKSIKMSRKTRDFLVIKSKELGISQEKLINFAFNKITAEELATLRATKELICA
ncbi:MAG: hypothetical protein FWK04_30080 [Nostoc sp. GBBB01]|nr:hypothetical protein [Nostoc sp. GBBB01]